MIPRTTRQTERARKALGGARGWPTASKPHRALLEERTRFSLENGYRQCLAEADSRHSRYGKALYSGRPAAGRNHLMCRSCGVAVEIAATEAAQWMRRTASPQRLAATEHVADRFRLSAACTSWHAAEDELRSGLRGD
ncbi:transcriptional repressor [Microbacterium deminutum]|uniref:Uncharacterized protein n=1 Tax=Microbacterium deminutum TaxID=344164 RepID=A0ABP5CKP8_9MICO